MNYIIKCMITISLGLYSVLGAYAFTMPENVSMLKDRIPSNEQRLFIPFYKIFIGEVVSLNGNGRGTNASPPKGRVRVYKALRGNLNNSEYLCVWEASVRHTDMRDPTKGDYSLKKEWKKSPLMAPRVGTKFIGFAKHDVNGNLLIIMHDNMYQVSDRNRDKVKWNAAPAERTGIAQVAAIVLVLMMPVLSLAFLRKKARLSLVLSMAVFPIYLFYESGISSWTNIRIDLLLVYPALFLAATMAVISGHKVFYSE